MNKYHTPCKNCNPCAILSGFGGAGTFSDGKLNFIPKLGKSDLTKYMSLSEANKLIDDTEEIFNKFNMDAEVYPSNMKEAEETGTIVFHAGTKETDGNIVTNGGRVLAISALGKDIAEAIANAYKGVEKVKFENMQYRTDIGKKAFL